jgi:hypothetical protein
MNEFRVTTERYQGWDEAEIKRRVSLAYSVILNHDPASRGSSRPADSTGPGKCVTYPGATPNTADTPIGK